MEKKIRIGLFFGGKSFEHEVSLRSMKGVFQALDNEKFEPVLFPVSKEGKIYSASSMSLFDEALSVDDCLDELTFFGIDALSEADLSAVFSTMHGGNGENGAFQGLFNILSIAYVGPGILGSAIAMDKDVTKRLLHYENISIVPYRTMKSSQMDVDILQSQGFPCFIKAASLGSSVGVYKCHDLEQAIKAAEEIFKLDDKLLVEKAVKGREIEVAILGTDPVEASMAGEVIPHHEFYSYQAKYLDDNGASFEAPAQNIDHDKLKQLAIKAVSALEIQGMARVDFFVTEDNSYYLNEINTLPGFTSISMYPKLFEVSGKSYSLLISSLIYEAISRFEKNSQLQKTLYANLVR
jgi:D-alanine-D-alanine ligase